MSHNFKYSLLPEASVIELPCFVDNDETAFSILGGRDYVRGNIEQVISCTQLRFPMSDPLRQYILGSRESTCGLLIRVKRFRSQCSSSRSTLTSEVVGGIRTSFQFMQPADYQVIIFNGLYIHSIRTLTSS